MTFDPDANVELERRLAELDQVETPLQAPRRVSPCQSHQGTGQPIDVSYNIR